MDIDQFFKKWADRPRLVDTTKMLLASLGISLCLVHLSMIWRVGALSFFGLSVVFWSAIAALIWDKRETLQLKSGIFSSCFAITLLLPLLIKSVFLITQSTSSLYLFPLIAFFSLTLLASGFQGLGQYKREFLILFILCAVNPLTSLLGNFDPSPLTAKLTGYLLWYSGFETVREGVNLYFAGSSNGVEVYPGCSGLASMIDLLSLTLLFFLMFPSNWKTKFILPIAAILIGFVMNSIRVALLAVIVAYHNRVGFEYWHSGEGSLLFSMMSMSLLCTVIYFLIQSPSPLGSEQEKTE